MLADRWQHFIYGRLKHYFYLDNVEAFRFRVIAAMQVVLSSVPEVVASLS